LDTAGVRRDRFCRLWRPGIRLSLTRPEAKLGPTLKRGQSIYRAIAQGGGAVFESPPGLPFFRSFAKLAPFEVLARSDLLNYGQLVAIV
jgi:hypothetical protein